MLAADQRFAGAGDGFFGNGCFENVVAAGDIVHQVKHQPLEEASESASASALFDRLNGQFVEGVVGELEFNAFHGQQLGVLLCERVLGVRQDRDELRLAQFGEDGHHGQAADELGDETETEQVFRLDELKSFLAADG